MEAADFVDPFERLLADLCPPETVRAIEAGASTASIWQEIVASGFLDALVPEEAGGAGLAFGDVAPLLIALGRNPVPLPIADTMIARGLLAASGTTFPEGPIVLATLDHGAARAVPVAMTAAYVLADTGDALKLLMLDPAACEPTGNHHDLAAHLRWPMPLHAEATLQRPPAGLRATAAVLRAAEIAGLADRLMAMTVDYANQRVQFGRPIGKQQAIQQQLALMAERAVQARIAAQLGCTGGFPAPIALAAVAKQMTSAAAPEIAAIAHAVHGAIGIAEEYDLQLFTRRLHRARLADGSESYWARLLGADRLADAAGSTLDYVRQLTMEAPAA